MATTPPITAPNISEALNRLWAKFLPEIEHRLSLIELAAQSLSTGSLSESTRQAAHEAAHKLAGSLGTFGLQSGTELARRAENLLAESPPPAVAHELEAWAADLRVLIQSRT